MSLHTRAARHADEAGFPLRRHKKVVLPALLALAACLAYGQANGRLQIHFMDVGQGDGAILVSPTGETVLFDNGTTGECDKPVSYLLRLGVKRIDYHIATHYHSDHIGCTAEVLRQLPLQHDALDRGGQYSTAVYDRYVAAVGSHRKTASPGMKILLDAASGQPVEIEIVALNGNGVRTTNENDLSISAVIRYGSFHAEIGGDLSGFKMGDYEDIETGVSDRVGQVEVYKVHHHGSSFSSNATWLAKTKPVVGIISVGAGNTYGHPSQDCLNRLHAAGVKTYWTERGAGTAPESGRDVVADDVVVQAEPGSNGFTVTYGATTDHYNSWETTPSAVNAASFQPGLSSSAWAAVYGKNFTSSTRAWREDEIVDGKLPIQLDGVSVRINGRAAAVSYISPTQINVQVPDDDAVGPVQVQVTTAQGTATALAQMQKFSPGLFTFDGRYVAAQHPDYGYVGRRSLLPGVTTTPVKPGGIVILWGTGFGPSTPVTPSGQLVLQAAPSANRVSVLVGGVQADVQWAGISGAGLWQINIKIPDSLADGDALVIAEVDGVHSQDNAFITVGR